ncbi:MAG: hypothetical protein EUB_02388 [Eubacterium sp.]|uniref:hypothetical protein n=1 Tax=Eubacterium sp. TaxID=142586 RepID=UPI00301F5F43
MERILFITGRFVRGDYPNGNCVKNISKELKNKHMDIDFLCIEPVSSLSVSRPDNADLITYRENLSVVRGLIHNLFRIFYLPLDHWELINKSVKKVCMLYEKNKYDAIIATVNPMESAEIVRRVKKRYPEVKFIIYEIDPASNRFKNPSSLLEKYYSHKAYGFEKRVYASCNHVFHMITHKNHFEKDKYMKYRDKSSYLDIPSFQVNLVSRDYNANKCKFIYAGMFYPVLRRPDYMMTLMGTLGLEKSFVTDIFTGGIMQQEVETIAKRYPGCIKIKSMIPKKELVEKYHEYSCLLSVGNKNSNFLPSKVLDYIGTGMPVIHFYSDLNDVAIPYLKKYSKALLIDQNTSIESAKTEILAFLDKVDDFRIVGDELSKLYYKNTPVYTAEELVKEICKN